MSKDISDIEFKPVKWRGYTLDELSQEALCENLLEDTNLDNERLRALVKEQTRSPGVIADGLTRSFVTFLKNEEILTRNINGDGWTIKIP
jgi:hypothetical protein